jgi:PAS domain S-box-containing protein
MNPEPPLEKILRQELETSEKRYRQLFESAREGILIFDAATGRITAANRYLAELLDYLPGELLEKRPWEFGLFSEGTPAEAALQKLPAQGEFHYDNLTLQSKTGRPIAVELFGNVKGTGPEKIVQCHLRDITNYRKAEQTLRQSLSLLQATLDSSSDGILVADHSGRITGFNGQFARHWRLPHSIVESHADGQILDLIGTQLKAPLALQAKVQEMRARPEAESFDVLECTDGRVFECYSKPQQIGGQPVGRVWSFRDVTARKRGEEEIRRLSRAVEQSPVSVIITDPAGKIEYVNRKCCELTGYRREELLGMNPRVLKSGEMPPEVYQQMWNTVIAGGEWRGEFHNRKKDGELYWENASISAIRDDTGRITHFLAVKEDITRQRLLEEQLRQAQKMEAVGQLAGGVAHGFNNILTSTLMQLGLLLDDPKLTEGTRTSLKQLESEAQRAADLARQLLTFSRRQVIQRKPVDLNKVLAGLGKTLQQLMGEPIAIDFAGGNTPLWIEADVRMIEQVVTNLCVNARDAMMPGGGRLTIDAKLMELDAAAAQANPEARPGLFVCLSVTDTGRGMDERTLKHTFEPFFTTKEVGKGMGLGLATVYGIAKQHEGWVEATSQVRHGSVFRVYLPALITAAPPRSEAIDGNAPQGKELILLVEDEPAVREMVALGLQLFGYRVLEAANGAEALKIWEKQAREIDLLFTDMRMPGMTGMELYGRLKRSRTDLKAVLSSGYSEEILKLDRITDQGITFLPKPYNIKTLAVTVRNCLDQK